MAGPNTSTRSSSASASSSHQAPSAPSAARAPSHGARGREHRVDAGQAGEAEQRARRRAATTSAPSAGSSSGGRATSGDDEQRRARPRVAARRRAASAASPPAASQPARGKQRDEDHRDGGGEARARPAGPASRPASARPRERAGRARREQAPERRAAARAGCARAGRGAIVPPVVRHLGQGVGERVEEVGERAALVRVGPQRAVDRRAQRGRQVAAGGGSGRGRGRRRAARSRRASPRARVDARERLVEHEPERVEVGALVDARARRLLGRHVGERADDVARCSVSGSSPARCATPKSVSFAAAAAAGRHAGTMTFCGLTSRCTTPRSWACPSASREREPDRAARRGPTARPSRLELGERAALDELGDEVAAVVLLARVVDGDDRRVVEPRGGVGLALRALGRRARRRG